MISNPFNPPPPGSDDPHQGVDFSVLGGSGTIALEGDPVQAVLSGSVAAVLKGRFPYGNAVLVETRLDALPSDWGSQWSIPTPAPTLESRSALTCPEISDPGWETAVRSLYLLYAHLKEPPDLKSGDAVSCGQPIGAIGSSGNALNPHLHLEARLGPDSVRFASLGHYESSATQEEMANYCAWRVSGWFQLVDPMNLLSLQP